MCDDTNQRELRSDLLEEVEALLCDVRPPPLSAGDLLVVRRALAEEVRGTAMPEVLTMEEVARILRVEMDDLALILDELPAFEFAGRLRVRTVRLMQWIEHRERTWVHTAAARITGSMRGGETGKGVA